MKNAPEEIVERVLRVGKQYEPALLPPDIARGETGKCFDTALIAALTSSGKYRYVESVAMAYAGRDMLDKLKGTWVLHAWLTDGEHAFDPTWYALNPQGVEVPFPGIYVGIEMDTMAAADFVRRTEYQGILANAWRHPKLAEKAITSRL